MTMASTSFENLTLAQQVTLTVTPAIAATLSILGSSSIIWMIASDWQKKISHVKFRFLFALSISDIINSLLFLIWPIPMPSDATGVWGAFGNSSTCQLQGFFMQIGLTGSFYNGALSLYFLLTIRYGLSNADIAKKYELWCHLVAILWPLVTGLVLAGLQLFTVTALGCWLGPEPLGCQLDDTDYECTSHQRAYLYSWMFTGTPLLVLNLFIAFAMIQIYRTVRETTQKAQTYVFQSESRVSQNQKRGNESAGIRLEAPRRNDSQEMKSGDLTSNRSSPNLTSTLTAKLNARQKEASTQAFLYVVAFLMTHMFAFSKYCAP
jgi:hypothetical protein